MHGLINYGIRDYAIARGGEALWERVRRRAGVRVDAFVSMDAYPDSLTDALLEGIAASLQLTRDEVLAEFGRHWVHYAGAESFGPLMDASGDSLEEFLNNLDTLHARLRLAMPEMRAPGFRCITDPDGGMRVLYTSQRRGLAPMVAGMLEGLGERFGTPVEVDFPRAPDADGTVCFRITHKARKAG